MDGHSLMQIVVFVSDSSLLARLVKKGGDIFIKDSEDSTLLHAAMDGPHRGRNLETVKLILETAKDWSEQVKAAEPNLYKDFVNAVNKKGRTALSEADRCHLDDQEYNEALEVQGFYGKISHLLREGANPNKGLFNHNSHHHYYGTEPSFLGNLFSEYEQESKKTSDADLQLALKESVTEVATLAHEAGAVANCTLYNSTISELSLQETLGCVPVEGEL